MEFSEVGDLESLHAQSKLGLLSGIGTLTDHSVIRLVLLIRAGNCLKEVRANRLWSCRWSVLHT